MTKNNIAADNFIPKMEFQASNGDTWTSLSTTYTKGFQKMS